VTEGRMLGERYELRRLIGRGGMAEVYAAHDHVLGRAVAVKVLLDRFRDDATFTRRFYDEARHVARLNHPNLVVVFDTGTDAGQPFIVMELVHGRSLQQVIAAGGLTEDRALEIAADVCGALAYAHEHGLIHRDVKPGNILLADDGAVKVTDFGIARTVDHETVTRTASVLGTAAYLSPEQAQGLDVDTRSDLYSLGVVLFETLTGRAPFLGDTPVTVAYQHVQESPPPPRTIDPSISPAAEAITMRALAKNPANRYQRAVDMRRDLINARLGRGVEAPAVLSPAETALLSGPVTGRPVRTHEEERRRRTMAYAGLAVAAVLAIVAVIWLVTRLGGDDPIQVEVPGVVGQQVDIAIEILTLRGFDPRVSEEESAEAAPGTVLAQSPAGGELALEGSIVELVVAVGIDRVIVPDLTGLQEADALQLLRDNGLIPGTRERGFDESSPPGTVLSTSPAAGEEVAIGTRIDYVVSEGAEEVVVRAVVNRAEADAIFRLEEQGLDVLVEREYSAVVAAGFVVRQDPEPGMTVPVGTIVTIWVSQGPEPVEPPPPPPPPDPEPEPEPEPTP
jgi:eukaryotic-like serine/threonine-protein kinase